MPRSRDMSREDAFVYVFCALYKVVEAADCLATSLDVPQEDVFEHERARDDIWPSIAELETALAQEIVCIIRGVPGAIVADIRRTLNLVKEWLSTPSQQFGGELRELGEVVVYFEDKSYALHDVCCEMAKEVYGDWGGFWFDVAVTGQRSPHHWKTELPAAKIFEALRRPSVDEAEQELADTAEACDHWIYEQVMAGAKYGQIIAELKTKPVKWRRITTIPGIKKAAERYAERHGLPVPPQRKPGRPMGS